MAEINSSGLQLLHEQAGSDLTELKDAVLATLDDNEPNEDKDQPSLTFNSHAGDNATVAMMKDVVDRMGAVTGRRITWVGGVKRRQSSKTLPMGRSFSKLITRANSTNFSSRSNSVHVSQINETTESTPELPQMRSFRSCSARALSRRESTPDVRGMRSNRSCSARSDASRRLTGSSKAMLDLQTPDIQKALSTLAVGFAPPAKSAWDSLKDKIDKHATHNVGSAAFVCCSREDAITHARVLRSELAVHLGRACAVGGGVDSYDFVPQSEMFIVLLTKGLPTDPNALYEIWLALQEAQLRNLPIIPIALTGGGYVFAEASDAYSDLTLAMENNRPGSTGELLERLPRDTDVASVGRTIRATLTAIIAIPWSPNASRNHMESVLADISERMTKVPRAPVLKRQRSSKKNMQAAAQQAVQAVSSA